MFLKMSTCVGVLVALLFFLQNLALASTPVQITTDPGRQGRPEVYEDTIVWKDLRAGNWDVYSYDIPSGAEQTVTAHPAYQNLPVTNGLVVVWQDDRNGDNDIFMRDLVLGIEQPLVTGAGNQGLPAISGNTVAFVDDSSGSNDIKVIDLTTRAIESVCLAAGSQWQPRISGRRIVWQDDRAGKWDIYFYDRDNPVADGQPLAAGPGEHMAADIDGATVVWQDHVAGVYDISAIDLDSGTTTAITGDAAYQSSPRVSGDLVVWEDFRNDADPGDAYYDYDIYMMDLGSGVEAPLASGPSIQARPAIDRQTVVWEDTTAGNYDVWMATVPDTEPPVLNNETPADGSVTCASTGISASVSDNRAGIDQGTLSMSLDGQDVTADALLSGETLTLEPGLLGAGAHAVSVEVADLAGNQAVLSWTFSVAGPELSIIGSTSYWENYAEFENGILTVDFTISNAAGAAPAKSTMVLASPASGGVITLGPIPSTPSDIGTGSQTVGQLKYLVPPGVDVFKTTVFVGCNDACGSQYYFPGPPAG